MLNKDNDTKFTYDQEVYKYTEMMELSLAIKCLKVPVLEKKFIGHSILE
jgi:hypothetical protein